MSESMFTRALARAGIPILGVSFPRLSDRSTWVIHYAPEATEAQRAAGEALKLAYDAGGDAAYGDEQADLKLNDPLLRAIVRATYDLKTTAWTVQEYRDRIKALYRGFVA